MNFKDRYKYSTSTNLLGKGGFSRVFKATDVQFEREVALKIFNGEQSARYNLINEIKKVINLDHPNLCRYFDVAILESINALGESEKVQVGIMEYLDGGDIRTYIKNHPEKRDKLLIDVLNGLSFLHKHGIIHRDLKPQNILIKNTIDGPVAKITDFGISKAIGSEQNSSSTLLGTIEYMAPEQFNPTRYGINGSINTNLDLWSFGLMVYEIINGQSLFGSRGSNTSAEQVMTNILSDDYFAKLETLPEPYKKIVAACLIKDANKRVKDPQQLIPLFNAAHIVDHGPIVQPKQSGETEVIKPGSKDTIPLNVPKTPAKPEYKPTPKPAQKLSLSKKNSKSKYIFLGVGVLLITAIGVTWALTRNYTLSSKLDEKIIVEAENEFVKQDYYECIALITQFYDRLANKQKARDLLERAYRSKWRIDSIRTEIYRTGDYLDVDEFNDGLAAVYINGLYGYINENGKVAIEPKFQKAQDFIDGRAVVVSNNKYGYVDRNGKIIWPPDLEYARDFSNGFAAVNKKGLWGFIDTTGKLTTPYEYDQVGDYYGDHVVVAKNGYYGVIDKSNKLVIPLQYDFASYIAMNENRFFLSKNKKISIGNNDGKIISKEYDDIKYLTGSGYMIVRNGNKFGYINNDGKEVIPTEYEEVTAETTHDRFLVKQNNKYGFLNNENKKVTEFIYDTCSGFSNDYAAVNKNGKWGFINKSGKESIPLEFDQVDVFRKGVAIVKRGGKYGVINTNNKEVIPFDNDGMESQDIDNDFFIARKGEKLGLISKDKKIILEFEFIKIQLSNDRRYIVAENPEGNCLVYDRWKDQKTNLSYVINPIYYNEPGKTGLDFLGYENEKYVLYDYIHNSTIRSGYYERYSDYSLFKFEKNGKYGFMNYNFQEKIPALYKRVNDFSDGVVKVAQSNTYGFIDHTGRVIIPFKYGNDIVTDFKSGLARVYSAAVEDGYINKEGILVFKCNQYAENEIFSDYYLTRVNKGGSWGVVDITGKTIVPMEFGKDAIEIVEYGIKIKNSSGKVKLLDFSGEEIIPYKYEDVYFVKGLYACKRSDDGMNAICTYAGKELFHGDFSMPPDYDLISTLYNYKDGKSQYFNLFGKIIYEPLDEDDKKLATHNFESNVVMPEFTRVADTTVGPSPR
jgi:serine/threonine protein kinase